LRGEHGSGQREGGGIEMHARWAEVLRLCQRCHRGVSETEVGRKATHSRGWQVACTSL
jgi:hypothetical protein